MANSIQKRLVEVTVQAVKELYNADILETQIALQATRKEFEGQITIVTFPVTRFSKSSPEQTGKEIGAYLQQHIAEISDFNVIKGFLNIVLSDAYWITLLNQTITAKDFAVFPANGKKLMVEYSSPNTNKPLHLGHIRNNLLGYAVAEILKAYGYDVIKANLVNDRGIHICKSMLAWQKFGNGETPESTGLKGDHLVGKYYVVFDKEYKKEIEALKAEGQTEEEAKKNAPLMKEAQAMLQQWEAGNEEVISLWKTMNSWVYAGFEKTYKQLGVDFDKYYYESNTYLLGKDIIQEGLDKGVFFKKEDNSVWIDLTDEGLDQKLVLRGDGTSVYITQDLGTAQLKYDEFKMNDSIYVVGNEQDYHFKVLFLILKKLGKAWADGLFHLSYGMVDLPSGKMKSREGTVVDADDLMAEMLKTAQVRTEELGKTGGLDEESKAALYDTIGMGALKYFLLKVDPKKRLLFDPNESVDFQGHTGPFIQYTHARIKSVLSKAEFDFDSAVSVPATISSYERDLIQQLGAFPEAIEASAQEFSPAQLANYIYEVAKFYNKFYHEETILKAEDPDVKNFRLHLSASAAKVIAKGMNLLGIHVPERM
ncbi:MULTISPECIES: arginine--tRNA ligase [Sphingobacterium]|jgi:arginyl-tRNA synthetase|uniref:Arginine--tRNA ligase n=5 Tax=Sphingobacterium multivorum TaxID=28454 RepID=A0A2X2IYE4_SPHMU|nr:MULTISPECIES: arginine--tRNA ligase [Sphingobacterium]HAE65655.1 arginine--tRNA ligase [Sphingobacterium sp.]MDF2849316.1 arginine--tRNA ligase [Sphingobacterium multivorum]OFV10268.1 arginine--tRNA ligase [Sphingobacterium sp. HMSC13C05]QQT44982.1 arginine--tRNA ligase [Sphingobacterium multivorum]QRQ59529.1 arginine--tRNA ligase [Sphingobacterium multivorum]